MQLLVCNGDIIITLKFDGVDKVTTIEEDGKVKKTLFADYLADTKWVKNAKKNFSSPVGSQFAAHKLSHQIGGPFTSPDNK